MSKMCTKCEKHREGYVCERSAAIGQGITNQEAVQTICRKQEYNIHSMGESKLKSGRGAQLPSSAVVKISEKLLTKQKDNSSEGRGARVTIPAIFGKKLSTPLKQLNTHRRGESKRWRHLRHQVDRRAGHRETEAIKSRWLRFFSWSGQSQL